MSSVTRQKGGVFFLHGCGGTNKTFMRRTLVASLRSGCQIVLTVATSGITFLLLQGGRTSHLKFKIPITALENSTCNIDGVSELAQLLKITKLIIWDEALVAHKFCFEALDRTLKDIMSSKKKFGGKVIVFGGDFRQILPVITRGSRSDIVYATMNSSYIWDSCEVLTLTKIMCRQQHVLSTDSQELRMFSDWLLKVREKRLAEPNDGNAEIDIPAEFLIQNWENSIQAIFESTYPYFFNDYNNLDYLQLREILASTIELVEEINKYILSLIECNFRKKQFNNTFLFNLCLQYYLQFFYVLN